jgi:uncharacterized repeat protein (TIGR02543 family)
MKYGTRILIGVILSLAWTACDNFFQELIPPDDNKIIEFEIDGQNGPSVINHDNNTINIPWDEGMTGRKIEQQIITRVSLPDKASLLPISDNHIHAAFHNNLKEDEYQRVIGAKGDNVIPHMQELIKKYRDFTVPSQEEQLPINFSEPVPLLVISGYGTFRVYKAQVMVTVTFVSNGGSPIPAQEVRYGGKVTPPPEPVKPDGNFGGWFEDFECTRLWNIEEGTVKRNTILYAGWTLSNEYTVFFNSNGGTHIDPITVTRDERVDPPNPPPYKEGHTFLGWYEKSDFSDDQWNGEKITRNVYLYANWKLLEYTVTFDPNGGIFKDGSSKPFSQTVFYEGYAAEDPPGAPTRAGYNFGGWCKDELGTTPFVFTTPIKGDTYLYAKWNPPNVFTVTFDTKGGIPSAFTQLVKDGDKADRPDNDPTKEGYKFDDWYKANGNKWDFSMEKIYENTTLYAKWIRYTVTFITDGGSLIDPQYVKPEDTAKPPTNPIKAGHEFDDWYKDGEKWNFGTPITEDITLIAKWEKKKYSVTYVPNVPNGGYPEYTVLKEYDDDVYWTYVDVEHSKYFFGGWYTNSDMTDLAKNPFKVTGNITLYAKWKYKVTFNSNGGTSVPEQLVDIKDGKAEKPQINLTNSNIPGSIFDGWFREAEFQNEWNFNNVVTDNITLYAKWVYIVTFDSNKGSAVVPSTQKVSPGGNVKKPEPDPKLAGYILDGWAKDSPSGSLWNFDGSVNSNFTLYAKWIKGFTITFDSVDGKFKDGPIFIQSVPSGGNVEPPPYAPVKGGERADPDKQITGLIFGGWVTAKEGTIFYHDFYTLATEDITLYAKWIPVEMVNVPKGKFMMGSPTTEQGHKNDESPQHEVTLTEFYMGKFEVTEELYYAVIDNPRGRYFGNNNKKPKVYVNWYQAVEFCNRLSELQGLKPYYSIDRSKIDDTNISTPDSPFSDPRWTVKQNLGANGYRLPTEAQWEYAAKGGDGTPGNYEYSGSDNIGDVAWYNGNSNTNGNGNEVQIVGGKRSNGLGIHDMSGNVYEWCWDWYGFYSAEAQTNPTGPATGSVRVIRGGSFANPANLVRSAARASWAQSNGHDNYGFRVVSGACYNYDKNTDIGKWEGVGVE